ncbi:unnamed protein product [Soboliphyme baturini]|uniref:Transposase n=1 Tax=Soboliphyme baturini TaxID=241478 RepID=A0A183IY45_9BILA|nr:unnamed protein product [Soboliphyme baturini]
MAILCLASPQEPAVDRDPERGVSLKTGLTEARQINRQTKLGKMIAAVVEYAHDMKGFERIALRGMCMIQSAGRPFGRLAANHRFVYDQLPQPLPKPRINTQTHIHTYDRPPRLGKYLQLVSRAWRSKWITQSRHRRFRTLAWDRFVNVSDGGHTRRSRTTEKIRGNAVKGH